MKPLLADAFGFDFAYCLREKQRFICRMQRCLGEGKLLRAYDLRERDSLWTVMPLPAASPLTPMSITVFLGLNFAVGAGCCWINF